MATGGFDDREYYSNKPRRPLLFVAKYKCEKCGEKWKVRKTSGGRKKCQGEQCDEFLLPYKKEAIDKLVLYRCITCSYEIKETRCSSEVEGLPYCKMCRTDMKMIYCKDLRKPRRMFGEFFCGKCVRKWYSGNAWEGKGQQCRGCNSMVHPTSLRPLRPSSGYQAKEPHDQVRCQMCQELGRNCKEYIPKEGNVVKDDDIPYEEDDDEQSVITDNSSVTEVGSDIEDGDLTPTEDDPEDSNVITDATLQLASLIISDSVKIHYKK